jgi:uncharacterized membrane protein YdfJ with MMPL/SSD domain
MGVLVLVWQHGRGSHAIWGLPATGAITNWVPLIAFAFLYGLSMDHEVFILSRIREEHDRTGSATTSVIGGIARALFVPALVAVFGPWNWWLPRSARRLLRTTSLRNLLAATGRHGTDRRGLLLAVPPCSALELQRGTILYQGGFSWLQAHLFALARLQRPGWLHGPHAKA